MSRKEFMEQLERLLMDIPQEERIEALSYYNGYFEDAGVENEESIIKELESPEKVAKIIKADIGVEEQKEYTEAGYEDTRFHQQEEIIKHSKTTEQKTEYRDAGYRDAGYQKTESPKKEDRTLKIVLIVLLAVITSPLWLGIAGSILGVILGVIGTVFGIAVAGVAVVFALYVVGFVLFGVGIGMFGIAYFAAGIGLLGAGMILLALAVLGTIACVWLFGRLLPWMIKEIINLCSRLFHRKGTVA